jgi:hypothetical protein
MRLRARRFAAAPMRGRQSIQRSPTAFDTNSGAQTRDFSSRGSSSIGAARGAGNFGGGRMGGGGRGGGGRR